MCISRTDRALYKNGTLANTSRATLKNTARFARSATVATHLATAGVVHPGTARSCVSKPVDRHSYETHHCSRGVAVVKRPRRNRRFDTLCGTSALFTGKSVFLDNSFGAFARVRLRPATSTRTRGGVRATRRAWYVRTAYMTSHYEQNTVFQFRLRRP